jgi:hypothetical protein
MWAGLAAGIATTEGVKICGQGNRELRTVLRSLDLCGIADETQLPFGDKVCAKGDENAFLLREGLSPLAEYLKRTGKHRLIISGMQTTACVPATVVGALLRNLEANYDFEITVVTDMLADGLKIKRYGIDNAPLDPDPHWHREQIENAVKQRTRANIHGASVAEEARRKVRYMTSEELLRELKPDQAPGPADPEGTRRSGSKPTNGCG